MMASLIPPAFRPFRLALIQLATSADKQSNLRRARQLVKEACSNGANVVVLPVCRLLFHVLTVKGVLQ
jgi:omega-amidase